MTKLDALLERARNAPIDRAAAARCVRGLDGLAAGRPAAGDAMGSYEIVRQIGEGGMGAVYLGRHTILDRPAAIKVLLPELSRNRDIVGRFFNEARAAAAIRHPGIVDIYDFGFLPDGAAYIAMEYLEGETLSARLQREGRLPVAAAIAVGRQIAAALGAAHDKGITHRDLKPDNAFLVSDPEIGERVKLLDFGIAKLVGGDRDGPHTSTGAVLGTPVYMSPEQCRGASTLDSRSDLYSLGCILYELLAGRPVFDVESANDIAAHHMYFEPEPLRAHAPSVPASLDKLIASLLRKDPAQRPATASEVAARLERCRSAANWPVHMVPPAQAPTLVARSSAMTIMAPGAAPAAPIGAPPERPRRGVQTTLSEAAGAMSNAGRSTIARRRRAPSAVWLGGGAALAAAAAIAITAAWPRRAQGPESTQVQSVQPRHAERAPGPEPAALRPSAPPPKAEQASGAAPSTAPPMRSVLLKVEQASGGSSAAPPSSPPKAERAPAPAAATDHATAPNPAARFPAAKPASPKKPPVSTAPSAATSTSPPPLREAAPAAPAPPAAAASEPPSAPAETQSEHDNVLLDHRK